MDPCLKNQNALRIVLNSLSCLWSSPGVFPSTSFELLKLLIKCFICSWLSFTHLSDLMLLRGSWPCFPTRDSFCYLIQQQLWEKSPRNKDEAIFKVREYRVLSSWAFLDMELSIKWFCSQFETALILKGKVRF